jgi:hypothetical protein
MIASARERVIVHLPPKGRRRATSGRSCTPGVSSTAPPSGHQLAIFDPATGGGV